jgi:glycosyltransferase 2 family protein
LKGKSIRYIIGFILTALAIWLSFRNLDWAELQRSITRINFFWVLLALFNVLLTVYILGLRWRVLLKSKKELPLGYLFKLNIISQYLNIVIPGRFGELAKSWLPAKRYGFSGSYVLGTVVIEKMFDFFSWVILWVSVPIFFAFQNKIKGYTMAVVICIILIITLILVIWQRDIVRRWLYKFSAFLPAKLEKRVVNFLVRGLEAFSQLKSTRITLILALYTTIIVVLSTLTNFLLFHAFGFQLSFFHALVLLLVIQVGSTPPSLPGKLGIFEYTVIIGLGLFSIQETDAMGYALLLHIVSYLPKIILGFIFMAGLNLNLKTAEAELSQMEIKDKIQNPKSETNPNYQ